MGGKRKGWGANSELQKNRKSEILRIKFAASLLLAVILEVSVRTGERGRTFRYFLEEIRRVWGVCYKSMIIVLELLMNTYICKCRGGKLV